MHQSKTIQKKKKRGSSFFKKGVVIVVVVAVTRLGEAEFLLQTGS
jgi:hypothetical protein